MLGIKPRIETDQYSHSTTCLKNMKPNLNMRLREIFCFISSYYVISEIIQPMPTQSLKLYTETHPDLAHDQLPSFQ